MDGYSRRWICSPAVTDLNFDLTVQERGTIGEFDWLLDVVEDAPTDDGKLDVACNALQALVGLASPPWRILRAIGAPPELP